MRIYFDASMGAAGDMIAASLLSAHPDPQAFLERFNSMGLEGVRAGLSRRVSCGITGAGFDVSVDGESESSAGGHMRTAVRYAVEMDAIVGSLSVPAKVRDDALAVFSRIFEAESRVHGEPVGNIHLHELGSLDAIADIVAVCWLMRELDVTEAFVSPVNTGSGTVRTAHGVMPVPAPATAELIGGLAVYSDSIAGELLTPTGAALLSHFCVSVASMPVMTPLRVGVGMGTKEFARPNCVRAFLCADGPVSSGQVWEICANIDDMTGEDIAWAAGCMMEAGALDAFVTPVIMKKGRPAFVFTVLCGPGERDRFAALILEKTTSIGVRMSLRDRLTLDRRQEVFVSGLGEARLKRSGASGFKFEHDDLERIAGETGKTVFEVRRILESQFSREE